MSDELVSAAKKSGGLPDREVRSSPSEAFNRCKSVISVVAKAVVKGV